MQITVNGLQQEYPDGLTVAQLIENMELNPLHVAVEVNKQLVTRSVHNETTLNEGDQLEVVTLVGGG
ncbi:MAG: sulfur carrier protein ThiS [Phycisphaerae bacterium]|nr:sulfur carrier protein ThiS [Phycisphaerae bacterium]